MKPDKNQMFEVLKVIQSYYPVGFPYSRESFPGYKKLRALLAHKIDSISDGREIASWAACCKRFKEKRLGRVEDKSYYQAPSLRVDIQIKQADANEVQISDSLVIYISLLAPYYTMFLEKQVNHGPTTIPRYDYFLRNAHNNEEDQYFTQAREIIEGEYPEHEFIDHDWLFKSTIYGAIPHGEDYEAMKTDFPAFAFLFGLHNSLTHNHLIDYYDV